MLWVLQTMPRRLGRHPEHPHQLGYTCVHFPPDALWSFVAATSETIPLPMGDYRVPLYDDDHPNNVRNFCPGLNLNAHVLPRGWTYNPPKPGKVTPFPALTVS